MNPKYIGTKLIAAVAMTRAAYNQFRGWTLPADERGEDEGYLVEYLDGGKPNVEGYAGYVSWSPKEQFDAAYRPCSAMTFGLAIEALKRDERVARAGWNGKRMFLQLTNACDYQVRHPSGAALMAPDVDLAPWIAMKTADDKYVPWLASQTDMLAEDWQIVTDGHPV